MGRWQRVVAGVLLLALLPTSAVAQTGGLEAELREYEREQQAAREELAEVESAATEARDRLIAAERELEVAQDELDELEVELAGARADLTSARARSTAADRRLDGVLDDLAAAEADLAAKQAQLEVRLRSAFMYGRVSLLDAFTGVRDLNDLMVSTSYVGHVLQGDQDLVTDVGALVEQVEQRRVDADGLRVDAERETEAATLAAAEVERAVERQQELAADLEVRQEERGAALAALEADAAAITDHLESLAAASSEVASQLREAQRQVEERLAREREAAERAAQEAAERAAREAAEQAARDAEAAAQAGASSSDDNNAADGSATTEPPVAGDDAAAEAPSGPPPSGGGWLRPTQGRVSSPYGWRIHPIHGTRLLHSGVDLASGTGTPIRAARGGIVTDARWIGGYGYTVLVYHGDGLGTLYAHMSAFDVAAGQSVSQGQILGREGMTGTATGPHLHFEVRVDGAPVDPCAYVGC